MLRLFPGTLCLLSAACLAVSANVAPEKRPLDHDAYARWHTLESPRISSGGSWVAYGLEPGDAGDGRAIVRSVQGDTEHVIEEAVAMPTTASPLFLLGAAGGAFLALGGLLSGLRRRLS